MQGRLGERLIPQVIREIAERGSSGLLRVTRGKAIKAVFFEAGMPRFAISNLANEQLDHKLIKDGLATTEQIEKAKELGGKANQLGAALVRMGVLTEDLMSKTLRDQVMAIVLSLFEWDHGDYVFDDRIRTNHDVVLDSSPQDILLEGARHAATMQPIADSMAPPDGVVVRPQVNGNRLDTGKLIPIESYVLSRIDSPTPVSEVGALSGIPEDDAHRALCALISAGLLTLAGEDKHDSREPADEDGKLIEELREEVIRKLHYFTTADYYEVLEITRQATTSDIKTAYYDLAKKFHPDRYHQIPRDSELRTQLEAVFAKLSQAYETLKTPAQRAAYDDRLRNSSGVSQQSSPPFSPEAKIGDSTHHAERTSLGGSSLTGDLKLPSASNDPAQTAAPATAHVAAETHVAETYHPVGANAGRTAEYYYQQGRARFDRKEYHAAVHLLREAVKLDPSRPHYHLHLGIALINNPRTRREAEQHLNRAAELDPYSANVRVKLGMIYKELGLTRKAEHFLQEALSIDPSNRVAQRELGVTGDKKKGEAGGLGSFAKKLFKK